jgi:hypothetical protein
MWQNNKNLLALSEPSPSGRSNKTPKVQVQRAGGFYRARWEGRSTSCFAFTTEVAIKRLKFFDQR